MLSPKPSSLEHSNGEGGAEGACEGRCRSSSETPEAALSPVIVGERLRAPQLSAGRPYADRVQMEAPTANQPAHAPQVTKPGTTNLEKVPSCALPPQIRGNAHEPGPRTLAAQTKQGGGRKP